MIRSKLLLAGLLFVVCLLAAAQTVRSQQYATTTVTSMMTGSQVSTVAVGTQVVTTTSGQIMPIYTGPTVTIPGTHGVCGVYFVQAFNGTAGQVLTGSVNASSAVDVYVMTLAAFQAWEHQIVAGGNCIPSSLVGSQRGATSSILNTMLPAGGTYELVVNNLSETTVTAQISAALAISSPSLVTAVEYSTVTQQMIQTTMQTSVQTIQTTSSGSNTTVLAAAALVIVIVVAAAAYFTKSKRGKSGKN